MKPEKTLSERLTTKHQLIIRNDENLAEKLSFSFTYAKFFSILVVVFVLLFFLSILLANTFLAKWFDPSYAQMELNRNLYELTAKVDSLTVEVRHKDSFIKNFKRILSGDTSKNFIDPPESQTTSDNAIEGIEYTNLMPTDSQFRAEFEQSDRAQIKLSGSVYSELQNTFFFSPIIGFVSEGYNLKKGHYGVEITTKTQEPVRAIADGTVIMVSWIQDMGYVLVLQHRDNIISVYRHNAEVLEKVGNFVSAGSVISMVDNDGDKEGYPYLYFELWYNGSPLNPEEFIVF